jgi:hypothetical protein
MARFTERKRLGSTRPSGGAALACVCVAVVASALTGCQIARAPQPPVEPWRSALYPEDWTPEHVDEEGRFLHDFSYAGYARGERRIPARRAVAQSVHPSRGRQDDTQRIQTAIDRVSRNGGGVVMLEAGTYHIAPPDERAPAALRIEHNDVILRGAGAEQTMLINTEPNMRGRQVILVAPPRQSGQVWSRPVGEEIALASNAANRATSVRLARPVNWQPGDWIVLRQDVTDAFIREHDMQDLWETRMPGIMFYRQVTAVRRNGQEIEIDVPLRYPLRTRDGARAHRVAPHLEEVGIEDLSIGMVQSEKEGFGPTDFNETGTGAYEVHGAQVIRMLHVVNGWIRRVHTARPPGNRHNVHMVSNGIILFMCRNVTIDRCVIERPQYRGEGGNGYGITLRGSECLVTRCRVSHGRHNYSFSSMWTSGNVIHRSRSENADIPTDFHMHLSPANLLDNVTLNRDWLEARYRPHGTIVHGHTTTQSVFWNTRGERAHGRIGQVIVDSRQFGWGYVIGTQGRVTGVITRPTRVPGIGEVPARDTAPEDWVEGIGHGEALVPESLYEDQLERRLSSHRTAVLSP